MNLQNDISSKIHLFRSLFAPVSGLCRIDVLEESREEVDVYVDGPHEVQVVPLLERHREGVEDVWQLDERIAF